MARGHLAQDLELRKRRALEEVPGVRFARDVGVESQVSKELTSLLFIHHLSELVDHEHRADSERGSVVPAPEKPSLETHRAGLYIHDAYSCPSAHSRPRPSPGRTPGFFLITSLLPEPKRCGVMGAETFSVRRMRRAEAVPRGPKTVERT